MSNSQSFLVRTIYFFDHFKRPRFKSLSKKDILSFLYGSPKPFFPFLFSLENVKAKNCNFWIKDSLLHSVNKRNKTFEHRASVEKECLKSTLAQMDFQLMSVLLTHTIQSTMCEKLFKAKLQLIIIWRLSYQTWNGKIDG